MMSKYAKRIERLASRLLLDIAASGKSHTILVIVMTLMLITLGIEVYEDWNEDEKPVSDFDPNLPPMRYYDDNTKPANEDDSPASP